MAANEELRTTVCTTCNHETNLLQDMRGARRQVSTNQRVRKRVATKRQKQRHLPPTMTRATTLRLESLHGVDARINSEKAGFYNNLHHTPQSSARESRSGSTVGTLQEEDDEDQGSMATCLGVPCAVWLQSISCSSTACCLVIPRYSLAIERPDSEVGKCQHTNSHHGTANTRLLLLLQQQSVSIECVAASC